MTATTTTQVFRLPDLGEGLTEAEILNWRVAVGDAVDVDQIVVEVETAKAAVEVPVPFAGTVLTLHCEVGGVLDVGSPLISIAAPSIADGGAGEQYREVEMAGSGNVLIGYGTSHGGPSRRRTRVRAARIEPTWSRAVQVTADSATPMIGRTTPLVISPVVRRLAREHGIDLGTVTPGGTTRVIRRQDVETIIAASQQTATAPAPYQVSPLAGEVRIPLRGMRRAVAEKLVRSRTEIPDATTWVDVDATERLKAKNALQRAHPDRPVGLLALLARICVAGLQKFPELNASVDTTRDEIVRHTHIDLGIAAQTDRGLIVPVIRGAHQMTTTQLHTEATRLTGLARSGGIPPTDLTGGTFTLNNYGVFGVDGSNAIINHPEAAILGVGWIIDKPWVVDGALVVRKMTQLSLSFDHRVCDGGASGGFLRYVADCVERPLLLLADL
jgi:2-oxoisovalerate dehydrogenase E2 component (dihydrolipoyl transacylase)